MSVQNKSSALAFDVEGFCASTGLGRTFVFDEIKRGRLRARKAGRRTVILPEDAVAYLQSLPAADVAA